MARSFSTNFTTALNSGSVTYFFLIEIDLERVSANNTNRVTYYYTSFNRDISWNSQTWVGDGGVFEIDSPRFSSIIDREAYIITLTDAANSLSDTFKQGVIGNNIKVRLGLLNSSEQPMLGVDSNSVSDIVFLYSGFIDSPTIAVNWDTKIAKIEGTSPMADLDQINLTMISKDGMDQKNSTDTSFDNIYDDNETAISWGKI